MNKRSLLALALLAMLVSCTEETEEISINFGYEFYPLEVGKTWVYEVDSIVLSRQGTEVDTSTIFFREEIIETRLGDAGDSLFIVERFERRSDTAEWQIRDVFSLSRNATQAFRTEDNLRFVKMIFPVRRGDRWDGHQFFNPTVRLEVGGELMPVFENWTYQYTSVTDELITISQAEFEDVRQFRRAEEQYEAGTGLVYRRVEVYDSACDRCCDKNTGDPLCSALPWYISAGSSEYKAEKGFILEQRLVE